MIIYCCHCQTKVDARLTSGKEIYPHRADLYELPFWKCDDCDNFVGCYPSVKGDAKPLGCIPTREIKSARRHIHKLLDPIWQSGAIKRKHLYKKISDHLGYGYHTGNTRNLDECRKVYRFVIKLRDSL